MPLKNEIGNCHGRLKVFAWGNKSKHGHQKWWCYCKCGNFVEVDGVDLRSGHTKSCGCLRRKVKDELGSKYGRLRIIDMGEKKSRGQYWIAVCDCGNIVEVSGSSLRIGDTRSCGCLNRDRTSEVHLKDISGQMFGRLYVICRYKKQGERVSHWTCLCSCGNITVVNRSSLVRGHTRSCGCYHRERTSEAHFVDISGKTFSRLYVVCRDPDDDSVNSARWVCLCSCGNIVIVDGYSLNSRNTRSCGCLHRDVLASNIGPNHPNWNPDLTDEEREANESRTNIPEYREWRRLVFERDNYTCQICGAKRDLNAHHVKNYSEHPELRYDLDNGTTMCKVCHSGKDVGFHSIFGTKKQFTRSAMVFYVDQRMEKK